MKHGASGVDACHWVAYNMVGCPAALVSTDAQVDLIIFMLALDIHDRTLPAQDIVADMDSLDRLDDTSHPVLSPLSLPVLER